jgi:hypothetical protein
MSSEKFLKLGEKATSFYDPTTRWGIAGNKIVPILPAQLKSPRIKRFISGGGLTYATKEEYKEYLASLSKPIKKEEEVKEETKKEETKPTDINQMTKAQLYDYIKESGWDQEDIDEGLALTKKEEILNFIQETEANYE